MTETAVGPVFLRYLLLAGLCLLPLPLLVYRFRALQRAHYILERDGIRLRWGLRAEDIPMDQVDWVHPRGPARRAAAAARALAGRGIGQQPAGAARRRTGGIPGLHLARSS